MIRVELREHDDDPQPFSQTEYGYDTQGHLTSITDPRGTGLTEIAYGGTTGKVASITRPVTPSSPGIPAELS